MHKLLAFDLDGTLAAVGKGMAQEDILLLKELEQLGYTIAICSGKPTYYLCGFLRQIGLQHPVMVGENGGTLQFGVELPPKQSYHYPYSPLAEQQLRAVKECIDKACGDRVWYQPNEIGVTPFPKAEETFDVIQQLLEDRVPALSELEIYRHGDCFDITPKCINKANGIRFLTEIIGFCREDCIAVGDGVNDVPMFRYADFSIGIGEMPAGCTDLTFSGIHEALRYIRNNRL